MEATLQRLRVDQEWLAQLRDLQVDQPYILMRHSSALALQRSIEASIRELEESGAGAPEQDRMPSHPSESDPAPEEPAPD